MVERRRKQTFELEDFSPCRALLDLQDTFRLGNRSLDFSLLCFSFLQPVFEPLELVIALSNLRLQSLDFDAKRKT